jgi:predicted negative regulator of RcsB-dependent stress response
VSFVGVPQNDQDLASDEYQLVLHSIKQDLRAVLQRQAPAHAEVDFKVLMHLEAPQQLKDILQGLVYVAKIKDVANTRGGAQVSQHRRVLAQQTYNMLVQELGDVLQGQAVQRSLRDLSAGTNLDLKGNSPRNETVQSNRWFPAITQSTLQSDITNSKSSSTESVMDDDGTDASVQSSATVESILIQMLSVVDIEVDKPKVHQDIMEILKARNDDVNNTEKTLQNLRGRVDDFPDELLQNEINSTIHRLQIIQKQRKEHLDSYDTFVEAHNKIVFFLKQEIYNLYHGRSTVMSLHDESIQELDSRITEAIFAYETLILKTKTSLDGLKQSEKTQTEHMQALLRQPSVDED